MRAAWPLPRATWRCCYRASRERGALQSACRRLPCCAPGRYGCGCLACACVPAPGPPPWLAEPGPPAPPAAAPTPSRLESLELDKGGYDRGDLEALAAHVPALTRLVLAGGLVGPHLPEWGTLAHPRLQALELAAGRAVRLRIHTPQLTHLRWGPGRSGGGRGPGKPQRHQARVLLAPELRLALLPSSAACATFRRARCSCRRPTPCRRSAWSTAAS